MRKLISNAVNEVHDFAKYDIGYRYRNIKSYLRNRFFRKHYRITLEKMPKGDWWDTDSRLFEANFQLLADFVEKELSYNGVLPSYLESYYREQLMLGKCIHPNILEYLNATRWERIRNKKIWAEKLGIAHLDWEISLDNPSLPENERCDHQAAAARVKKDLYLWYKYEYSARPDSGDMFEEPLRGGLAENFLNGGSGKRFIISDEYIAYMDKVTAEDERRDKEDTEKLKQLIDIRHSLWT